MKRGVMLIAVLMVARAAAGQNADDYRGGWRTDTGEAHTFEFSIRGTTVRGIYCTYCADATTLAFVDGTFGPEETWKSSSVQSALFSENCMKIGATSVPPA